jgi:hypothetical protein
MGNVNTHHKQTNKQTKKIYFHKSRGRFFRTEMLHHIKVNAVTYIYIYIYII